MKCPDCGQWNRDSFTVCRKCGASLIKSTENLSWKSQLKDAGGKIYVNIDENGTEDTAMDSRDELADEMAELKIRKLDGEKRKREMAQSGAERAYVPPEISLRGTQSVPVVRADDVVENEGTPAEPVKIRRAEGRRARIVQNRGESPAVNAQKIQRSVDYDYSGAVRNDPIADSVRQDEMWQPSMQMKPIQPPKEHHFFKKIMIAFAVLIFAAVSCLCAFFGIHYFSSMKAGNDDSAVVAVNASMLDEQAAHTVLIPGEDGQQIYIRELHTSYVVSGGFATIEVADHTFYDDDPNPPAVYPVTLTPFVKTSGGKQKPLDTIHYDINVPLSPVEILSFDGNRTDVSTAMYSIKMLVRPGSTVYINDVNVSDTVSSENGEITYNATVQPTGDNPFTIRVRSQYCRENVIDVVLYREKQEIPLDLYAGTYTTTTEKSLEISATTLPGMIVDVLSPHSDLKITNLDVDGTFTFNAVFDHYGINTISISAADPAGIKKTSVVNYDMYYVPPQDEYTKKAWTLANGGYAELLGNITARAKKATIYLVKGKIDRVVSTKPQMVVINTSDDGLSQPVLIENATTSSSFSVTLEEEKYYHIYADTFGTYEAMPWLVARYIYEK